MRRRDELGRFLPGTDPGPGRPPAKKEKAYLDAFRAAVSIDEWTEATKAILKKAMDGNVRAFKALAEYALGKPTQRVEADIRSQTVGVAFETALLQIYDDEN